MPAYSPPTMERATELLEQLLATPGACPPAALAWLQGAFQAYIDGLGRASIEECLGMKPERSGLSIARRYARSKRVAAIVAAWRVNDATSTLSPWARCELLAAKLKDFEENFWPVWRVDGPPAGASDLRLALYDAFTASDEPPPMTAKNLHQALTKAGLLM